MLIWPAPAQTSEKPFVFSKLLLTDDADLACSDEAIIKGLGTIQLKIYRVGNVVASSAPAVDATGAVAAFVVVHERLKKATLSHQTGPVPSDLIWYRFVLKN